MNNLTFFIIFIILCLILKKHNLEKFTSSDKKDLENCKNNCGSIENPVTVPLPKCIYGCYTTSTEKNALNSCVSKCGTENNPSKVPLPNCLGGCYTTSNDPNALKSCFRYCGGLKRNPATVPLPKCFYQCHTTSNDPNALKLVKVVHIILLKLIYQYVKKIDLLNK